MKQILIACIGNIFLGDDGFGIYVGRELLQRNLPDNARLIDFGIASRNLAFELTRNYDLVIIVDAVKRNRQPGALCLIEPELSTAHQINSSAHDFDLEKALQFAVSLGAELKKVMIVGCEPESFEREDLSLKVKNVVQATADLVERIVADENKRS